MHATLRTLAPLFFAGHFRASRSARWATGRTGAVPIATASPAKKACPKNGRSTARTSPGRRPMAAAPLPSCWAITCISKTPPAARETEQERLLCFNADTGKLLWEYKFNLFQSDVPAHRVGWASPAADPETGNVYSFGVNNLLTALTKDGKKLWERSITEEFSPFTTHGGRTVSPIIDGNLVIVSTPTSTWGTQANRAQRFIALDKRTGDIVWISTPGGRPYDTSYGPMNIVTINGTRLLVTGGADGARWP